LNQHKRQNLQRAIRLFALVTILFLVYVLIDFSTTDKTQDDVQAYRIALPELDLNRAYFFKVGTRQIVIVRQARQGKAEDYFIAYAIGTNLGCPLQEVAGHKLKESCSSAEYDFSGQPVGIEKRFTALHVPVYNFCDDFSCINLRM
jgi:hypothetical protein